MLSPGAVVLVFLLGSAEGYATVRDDRVFASSLDQQSKNSTTSDRDGDMKVSVGVQADASVSELEDDMDGVQTLKAADDRSSLGETELNENAPTKKKECKGKGLSGKKGCPCFMLDQKGEKANNQKGECKKCEEKKYAGHGGCRSLTIMHNTLGDVAASTDCTTHTKGDAGIVYDGNCCEDWYEWGPKGKKICEMKTGMNGDTVIFTGCSGGRLC